MPTRVLRTLGQKNITNPALVESSKVILPSLHIKLGLMKQFVKALDKQGLCFKYISEKFPHLSAEKVKEGVLSTIDSPFEYNWSTNQDVD